MIQIEPDAELDTSILNIKNVQVRYPHVVSNT